MAIGAHIIPVLVNSHPEQFISRQNFLFAVNMKPFLSALILGTRVPAKWKRLYATIRKLNQVLLQWSTASEVNSQEFAVEHSTNGTVWNRIATIAAAGNSNESKQYSFLHVSPVKGRNFYRIRQRDLDGKSSTTMIRSVAMEEREKIVSLQNHVITNGKLQMQLSRPATIALFTQDGRMLLNKEFSAGQQSIELGSYAKGVYFLHCAGVTEKIVLR